MKKIHLPKTAAKTGAAAFCALCLFFQAECSTEAALQEIFMSSSQAPVFYGCKTGADGGVSFSFSAPVTLKSAYFDPPLEYESRADGETLVLYLDSDLPGGEKVTADLLVEDGQGNTLNVLVPFRTRNNRIPDLLVNEIRTEYSNMNGDKPRTEFVELRVLSAGNLGGLRLYAAGNNTGKGLDRPILEFPPIMVDSGEYVVIHTRTLPNQSGCRDETGNDLGYSGGYEATPARDIWIPGSAKRLHNTDAIFIADQDDGIIDGVLLCEKEDAWKNDVLRAARRFAEEGVWNSGEASSAVSTAKASPTRTVNRNAAKPDSDTAGDWYVRDKGNASPGAPNT
ncbi:MAG: hypothetical protein LBH35_09290 [Treponema sp.]|jgi:hypothetical protein|nr:hypothetical protein [Treponema sp.]